MTKRSFTLFLGKPDIIDFDRLFTDVARARFDKPTTQRIELPDFGEGARLYVFSGDDYTPKWLRELRVHFPIPGNIEACSACALLAFKSQDRVFAAPFAHAWMYIDESNIEGAFGLRVALNTLNDKKLRRLERANLGDAMQGISASPFQREFTSFGLDDALDLIRKVSGTAKDGSSAEAVSGAKSLKVSGEFGIPDLPQLAAEALADFGSIAYRETTFKVLDFVTPVLDYRLTKQLNQAACESVKANLNEFELGLPITAEDEAVAYKFIGPGLRGRYPDLMMRDYLRALGDDLATLDVEKLCSQYIAAITDDPAKPERKWSIHAALVGSLTVDDHLFAINDGEWYQLDQAFKNSIEEMFVELREVWPYPPFPLKKIYDNEGNGHYEREEDFNKRLAVEFNHCLFDQKLIDIPDIQRSGFEACDLLDIDEKRFIHIKKSSRRSNVLSHFFKQGSNSAQQLSKFPAAWTALHAKVLADYGEEKAVQLKAAIADKTRDWTVDFVIADTPRQDGSFNIPFFSKITLRDEVLSLRAMGYKVRLLFIGLEPIKIGKKKPGEGPAA